MSVIDFFKYQGKHVALICSKFIYSGELSIHADSFDGPMKMVLNPPVTFNIINANGYKDEAGIIHYMRTAMTEQNKPVAIESSSVEAVIEITEPDPEPPKAA